MTWYGKLIVACGVVVFLGNLPRLTRFKYIRRQYPMRTWPKIWEEAKVGR